MARKNKTKRGKKMMKKIILSVVFLFLGVGQAYGLTNLQIAQKSDAIDDGFQSSISTMKMILINASKQEIVRIMQSKTLEGDGTNEKSFMEFSTPADVKGTKMLTFKHLKKNDDQWLYLPAIKRLKRISSSSKSGSFMGSEFSYEDISRNSYKKYTYMGDVTSAIVNGVDCYKGQRVSIDDDTGYSKEITYIEKKTFLVQKVEYYDRKNELLKTAIFEGYKMIKEIPRVSKITMTNHQTDKKTILIWQKDEVKANLKAKDFKKRVLVR
jgi:hypothetical protein